MKLLSTAALLAPLASARYIMYADEWHLSDLGNATTNAGIDHAIMAFVSTNDFLTDEGGSFELFEPVETFRARFDPGVKVIAAIGGWNDVNYTLTMKDEAARTRFANNAKKLIDKYNLDGIDIDYEYVGGNGADYKTVPNSEKVWEIDAFPLLLNATRAAIGEDKTLSIAVPGLERDMMAFTAETMPKIVPLVDWFGIMTYDFMNRRDNYTKHHTDLVGSKESIQRYLDLGLPPCKATLGFAFYAKYFTIDPASDCAAEPLGPSCKTVALENADGSDNGLSGALTFEPSSEGTAAPANLTESPDGTCGASAGYKCTGTYCCSSGGWCGDSEAHCGLSCQAGFGECNGLTAIQSWANAQAGAVSDEVNGGHYFLDQNASLFWTWDEPEHIAQKFPDIVEALAVENVMAWSLAEDSLDWRHLLAIQAGVKEYCLSEIDGFNADSCAAAQKSKRVQLDVDVKVGDYHRNTPRHYAAPIEPRGAAAGFAEVNAHGHSI
ncbi:putative class v protein [Neofusicoccum parvum UCRNP2]|uniref:chitinase n=1 Tax=Botryosphaeria parva (strain UCR-NP2) TaxID=1287680 RepID=R1H3Z2_BOTPV|nr:putative class v protein [Neofusicoccum parvum UCRNP2]